MAADRTGWLRPSLTLLGGWAAGTAALIAIVAALGVTPPSFVKAGPHLVAGLVTGWLVPMSSRRPKIIAAAILVVVSASAWTAFTLISSEIASGTALGLFGASLTVMAFASVWAYVGMFFGGRRHETIAEGRGHYDDDDDDDGVDNYDALQRELRRERARDREP